MFQMVFLETQTRLVFTQTVTYSYKSMSIFSCVILCIEMVNSLALWYGILAVLIASMAPNNVFMSLQTVVVIAIAIQ